MRYFLRDARGFYFACKLRKVTCTYKSNVWYSFGTYAYLECFFLDHITYRKHTLRTQLSTRVAQNE
jgi:hypothetical protein